MIIVYSKLKKIKGICNRLQIVLHFFIFIKKYHYDPPW